MYFGGHSLTLNIIYKQYPIVLIFQQHICVKVHNTIILALACSKHWNKFHAVLYQIHLSDREHYCMVVSPGGKAISSNTRWQ